LAGGAAKLATTSWKEAKYTSLSHSFLFSQSHLKLGLIAPSLSDFLCENRRRLNAATGDVHAMAYLFQQLSIAIQHYNFVLIYASFATPEAETDN